MTTSDLVMGMVFHLLFHFIYRAAVSVVARSIGATKESTNIRHLLYNICLQLCTIYDIALDLVPTVRSFQSPSTISYKLINTVNRE